MMIELTFSRCEKSNKKHCNFPRFFSCKKDFWVILLERLYQKFCTNDVLGILNIKRSVKISGFVAVMFSIGEIPRRPSDLCPFHLENNDFLGPHAVSLTQNGIGWKKILSAMFLVRCPNNFFSNFWSGHFELPNPNVCFQ